MIDALTEARYSQSFTHDTLLRIRFQTIIAVVKRKMLIYARTGC